MDMQKLEQARAIYAQFLPLGRELGSEFLVEPAVGLSMVDAFEKAGIPISGVDIWECLNPQSKYKSDVSESIGLNLSDLYDSNCSTQCLVQRTAHEARSFIKDQLNKADFVSFTLGLYFLNKQNRG